MKSNYYQEFLLILISLIPLGLLAVAWDQLPSEIPTHYGLSGEADDWTKKSNTPVFFGGLALGSYLLLFLIPKIDPKDRIVKMGIKFFWIRLIMSVLISIIFILIILSSLDSSLSFKEIIPFIFFLFFFIFGNYIQTVQPNYFIGIRTPWTLEDPSNWKATHRLGGRIWMIGGIILFITAFFIPGELAYTLMLYFVLVLILIPVAYSAIYYFMKKKSTSKE